MHHFGLLGVHCRGLMGKVRRRPKTVQWGSKHAGLLGTPILNNSYISVLARKKVCAVKNKHN